MPTTRWPRHGCPLLPARLRKAWAREALPPAITATAGLSRSTTYAKLDDTAWEGLDGAAFRPLANHLRELVQRRIAAQPNSGLANEPILVISWPPGVDAASIPFSLRTRNVIERLGRIHDRPWMLRVTARELMDPHVSGPVTLLDFATVLEGMLQCHVDGKKVSRHDAIKLVTALRAKFPIDMIPCDDPRLDLRLEGATIGQALDGEGPRRALIVKDLYVAAQEVAAALTAIERQDLHRALAGVAAAVLRSRHARAVVRRLGWDGDGGCTLAEAAAGTNVSWQRIAQLEHKLRSAVAANYWFLPDQATAYIVETAKNYPSGGSQRATPSPRFKIAHGR